MAAVRPDLHRRSRVSPALWVLLLVCPLRSAALGLGRRGTVVAGKPGLFGAGGGRVARLRGQHIRAALLPSPVIGEVVQDLTRNRIRLEGLNTYSVVSALIMNSALRLFTSSKLQYDNWENRIVSFAFLSFAITCILGGAYSAITFTLIQLYSKRALGLNLDDNFAAFFHATHRYRHMGYHTFVASLMSFAFCFSTALLLKIERKRQRYFFFSVSVVVLSLMVSQWLNILAVANTSMILT